MTRTPATPLMHRAWPTHAIFFLSGIAGLGYQIVWARMFAVGLGHEMPSLLAVLVAFFGGLAVGAWALDRVVSRSATPGRWYAILEIIIGTWALLTLVLIPWLNTQIAALTGVVPSPLRHWIVAFAIPFLALLPATAAMGATLPAMDRFVSALRKEGRPIAGLYGANTLGAAAGVFLSTFLIMPIVGFRATVLMFALVNFFCALAIMRGPAVGEASRRPLMAPFQDSIPKWQLSATLFLTGLLGIGYEILGVRVMAQVLENTVYSYASGLMIYLLGTAVGAAAYHRWARDAPFRPTLTMLIISLSTTCIMGIFVLARADILYETTALRGGGGFVQGLMAEVLLALAVFALPTVLMGATFSHLAHAARHEKGGVGLALAINTLGGAFAPLLFSVMLLPMIGAKATILVIAAAYLLVIPDWRDVKVLAAAVPIALALLVPVNLIHVKPPRGGTVIDYREGVMAAVAVVDDPQGHLYLKVNNRFHMGGTISGFSERRQAHLPLLLHPNPKRALFLGVGTGITVGAATIYPELSITGVELVPEIIDLLEHFNDANEQLSARPNVALYVADARRYVRASREMYDVIVADLYHPARDGTGALYTREHFQAIRQRLKPGGMFCQWLPLYQLDQEMLALIIRTFLEVFPHANAYMAHYNVQTPSLALIGSDQPQTYPTDWFQKRTVGTEVIEGLFAQQQALYEGASLFGTYVTGRRGLERFAGAGSLNTDDRPLVVFRAPRFIYIHRWHPYARLLALLEATEPDFHSLFLDAADDAFIETLQAYVRARDVFLRGAVAQVEGRPDQAIAMFIESARRSSTFTTGYLTAVQFASQIISSNPEVARQILLELRDANPNRPEAGRYLRMHFGAD